MADVAIAKLFQNGRSQAVRLPREFRFSGDRVRIRRLGQGVLLEPLITRPEEWFAEMDRCADDSLLPEDRHQPVTPIRQIDLA